MTPITILVFEFVGAAIVIGFAKIVGLRRDSQKSGDGKVKDVSNIKFFKKRLLTPSEITFFNLLLQAVPDHFIFTQVALSQLVGVPSGPEKLSSFNRISRMSIDYVVCDAQLNTLLAIELDDPTHDRPSGVQKDLKKDTVLATAGIRLLRIRVESIPTLEALRGLLAL